MAMKLRKTDRAEGVESATRGSSHGAELSPLHSPGVVPGRPLYRRDSCDTKLQPKPQMAEGYIVPDALPVFLGEHVGSRCRRQDISAAALWGAIYLGLTGIEEAGRPRLIGGAAETMGFLGAA